MIVSHLVSTIFRDYCNLLIHLGVENLDAGVGVYAPDAEAYQVLLQIPYSSLIDLIKTFSPLFDKIIEDYHGFTPKQKQPKTDLGEGKTKVLID